MKIKLNDFALMPERAHETDAGLDLKTPVSFWLHPGQIKAIDTGIHVEIPDGYFGLLTSKSGLMLKGVTTTGTIDNTYRGSIKAVLMNHSDSGICFEEGQKITQLVLLPVFIPNIEIVDELSETERGSNGFGSSGL